jgi:hypothetical protein
MINYLWQTRKNLFLLVNRQPPQPIGQCDQYDTKFETECVALRIGCDEDPEYSEW